MKQFIGLGAQKAASTWLYDILEDHPEVAVSANKEVDYFSRYHDYGAQWYARQFPLQDKTLQESILCQGEISPSYLVSRGAPERARRLFPDARLVVVLRDPVERALSNHRHDVRIGLFQGKDLSFEAGLKNNPEYMNQGFYHQHLARWLTCFDQEQLLVLLVDDIRRDPAQTASVLYRHLGVSTDHTSAALHVRSNESYVNGHQGLEAGKNLLRQMVRKVGLGLVWEKLGDTGSRQLYRALNRAPSSSVIPDPEPVTLQNMRQAYLPDIERLEMQFGFDLSHWKANESVAA